MSVENVEYQGPEVDVVYGTKSHNLRTGNRRVLGDFSRNNCPIAAALATVNRVGKKGFSSDSHSR
jgi:hypothetical protein